MIIDLPEEHHWVYIMPNKERPLGLSEEEYLEHYGKWLISGCREDMKNLARLIDPLVESGQIDQAKYNKKEWGYDLFPLDKEHCMCVYSDNRRRDELRFLLENIGVKKMRWKYERETLEDWKPGGRLAEESRKQLAFHRSPFPR